MIKDRQFYKTIFRLSLPAAFQSLLSMLVVMADNVMISRYQPSLLASVSQANSVTTFISAALTGLASGSIVLISQYHGKGDHGSVKRVAAACCTCCLLLAVAALLVIQLFPYAVLSVVINAEEVALTEMALPYFRIVCLSYLPFAVTCAMVGMLKGIEVVRVTLYATLLSLGTNVLFNWVLIHGYWGFPELGAQGAALATVLARVVEMAVVLWYCFKKQQVMPLRPKELLRHQRWAWRDYAKYGLPVGLTDAQWALVGMLKMAIIGHVSEAMMGAMNITDTMMGLGTMFTFALAGGACVVVGKAVGEKDYEKVRAYSHTIQVMFAGIGVVMALVVFLLRVPFVGLYGTGAEVSNLAGQMIAIGAVTLLGTTYHASCFVGINRGAGDSQFVMKVDLICGWLVVLPLTYLAAFRFSAPLPVIFLCTRMDQCFKWIIAFFRLRGKKWIKNVTREGEPA